MTTRRSVSGTREATSAHMCVMGRRKKNVSNQDSKGRKFINLKNKGMNLESVMRRR